MAKRSTSIGVVLIVLATAVLVLAWIDGGKVEQRPVVEPVVLPGAAE